MNDYRPEQIDDYEWITTTALDSEHFTGGPNVYASLADCERAIQNLREASPALIQAAMQVVAAWKSGDLAAGVRALDNALHAAWEE